METKDIHYNIRLLKDGEEIPYDLLMLADPSRNIIDDYVKRGKIYICESTELIGIYVLLRTRPNTIELVNIAVREDMQGTGIGKNLVLDAIQKSRKEGVKTIEVGTGNSSLHQIALYQKCGFRINGVDRDFFTKHYEEDIFENGIKCVDMIRLSLDL